MGRRACNRSIHPSLDCMRCSACVRAACVCLVGATCMPRARWACLERTIAHHAQMAGPDIPAQTLGALRVSPRRTSAARPRRRRCTMRRRRRRTTRWRRRRRRRTTRRQQRTMRTQTVQRRWTAQSRQRGASLSRCVGRASGWGSQVDHASPVRRHACVQPAQRGTTCGRGMRPHAHVMRYQPPHWASRLVVHARMHLSRANPC